VTTPQVRIRSAGDLFEVLSTGSLAARLAVLSDIVANPTRPLALGTHEGEDFVDLLIRLIPDSRDVLRKTLILCLMCYQDPRTQNFLGQIFAEERDAATVLHLGPRLTLDLGVDFFRPFLWGEKAAQALVAARILAQNSTDLEPKERLRVALLVDYKYAPPELSRQNLSCWVAELEGPHRFKARQLAEESGEAALLLWSVRDQLSDLAWLLELTEQLDAARAVRETESLLPSGALYVVRTAQRLGLELPVSLLESSDPEVRAAAISAGLADSQLEGYLTASLPEALAALPRCPSSVLTSLLSDSRWPVRSAAVGALATHSDRPLSQVRSLAMSESLAQRVAAVTLLNMWGDVDWLEEQLSSDPGSQDTSFAN
jgi:hypothetical protein